MPWLMYLKVKVELQQNSTTDTSPWIQLQTYRLDPNHEAKLGDFANDPFLWGKSKPISRVRSMGKEMGLFFIYKFSKSFLLILLRGREYMKSRGSHLTRSRNYLVITFWTSPAERNMGLLLIRILVLLCVLYCIMSARWGTAGSFLIIKEIIASK